jgi:hypothetical protein
MDGGLNEIRLHASDQEINRLIKSLPDVEGSYSVHYNQNEDFFIQLDRNIVVPHIPIHHDVRTPHPSEAYRRALVEVVEQISAGVPQIFHGLTYFFDPGDIHRPAFFQVFKLGETRYLYMVHLDLKFRTHDAEMTNPGTNDVTAEYRTRKVFLDASLIPIDEIKTMDGGRPSSFVVHQTISQTWIGETGRGYLIQGIWMDQELTKFFSKLFVPKGVRSYPYYPFVCRYRTVCHMVLHLSPQGRKDHIPNLHRAVQFLEPEMRRIEGSLKSTEFTENLPVFMEIKAKVPAVWGEIFKPLKVSAYLNDQDMKEFLIEA